jgi:hypothetical protein
MRASIVLCLLLLGCGGVGTEPDTTLEIEITANLNRKYQAYQVDFECPHAIIESGLESGQARWLVRVPSYDQVNPKWAMLLREPDGQQQVVDRYEFDPRQYNWWPETGKDITRLSLHFWYGPAGLAWNADSFWVDAIKMTRRDGSDEIISIN